MDGRTKLLGLLLATASGCGSEMTRAADRGDRPALGREIAVAEQQGKLTTRDAALLAHVVLLREIVHAPTPEYGLARVKDAQSCAFAADDVLAERMKTEDAVGGEAALERLFAGALTGGAAREHAASADDRWRAVAMGGMTRDVDHEARLRGLTDGSPLVRRAALHAILEHEDPADFDPVFEAARLDPDPLVQSSAVRALPRLAGDRVDVANKLRDLWSPGDDGLREDLAGAFATRAVFSHGGRDALFHILSAEQGNAVIAAAGVVVHTPAQDDVDLRALALGRLVHAVGDGSHRERMHAIAVAPLGPPWVASEAPVLDSVRVAAKGDDLDVRIAALGRLIDPRAGLSPREREEAVRALEGLAAPAADSSSARASRARWLLAEAGDMRVQAWLEADLHAKDADVRLTAGEALAALGRASRAAPLLADEDPSVRTRGACAILMASSR